MKQLSIEDSKSCEYADQFLLDVNLRPSYYFDVQARKDKVRYETQVEEQGEDDEEDEEGNKKPKKKIKAAFEFVWHCKGGFFKSIKEINKEFNVKRGLKPVRIFMTGPPAVGKSYYGKQ